MKTLGNSDLEVSAVGLGCINLGMMVDQAATDALVSASIDAGINFFDVADIYGGEPGRAEKLLGKALAGRRENIVLATKFGAGAKGRGGAVEKGGSRDYIMTAVEKSLTNLGTDYIDLYQHHFPDSGTPVEETIDALNDLVRAGKVRYIGCSNYSAGGLRAAQQHAEAGGLAGYVSAQNRYSLLYREIEGSLVPAAAQLGVGILPYFPLESGLLTGKYRRDEKPAEGTRFAQWGGGGGFVSDERWDTVEKLTAYGESIGRSLLDIAIGWLAAQPYVSSVIAGATRPHQVEQNAKAGSWELSAADIATIDKITRG